MGEILVYFEINDPMKGYLVAQNKWPNHLHGLVLIDDRSGTGFSIVRKEDDGRWMGNSALIHLPANATVDKMITWFKLVF